MTNSSRSRVVGVAVGEGVFNARCALMRRRIWVFFFGALRVTFRTLARLMVVECGHWWRGLVVVAGRERRALVGRAGTAMRLESSEAEVYPEEEVPWEEEKLSGSGDWMVSGMRGSEKRPVWMVWRGRTEE